MITLDARKSNQFTFKYSQPDDYHFCLDSVILAEFVAEQMKDLDTQARVLDLCAGCGVIGFELAYHLPQVNRIDFVEIQSEFNRHFDENLKITGRSSGQFRFLNQDFQSLEGEYDLIVCNPPYFNSAKGKLGISEFKNRCHFFLDSSLGGVLNCCVNLLSQNGRAFILAKQSELVSVDLTSFSKRFKFVVVALVRGTAVIEISKATSADSV